MFSRDNEKYSVFFIDFKTNVWMFQEGFYLFNAKNVVNGIPKDVAYGHT